MTRYGIETDVKACGGSLHLLIPSDIAQKFGIKAGTMMLLIDSVDGQFVRLIYEVI